MTKEEFYVKLMLADHLRDVDFWDLREHSRNYEISELILKKFNLNLSFYDLEILNKQAVSKWFHAKTDIRLPAYFKGVEEVLPEVIKGNLGLVRSNILELPNLKRVEGDLDLSYSKVLSLPNLEFVGGDLILNYSEIQDLDNLKTIKGNLKTKCSFLRRLPALEEVGGFVFLDSRFWVDYFRKTGRSEISEKCSYQ